MDNWVSYIEPIIANYQILMFNSGGRERNSILFKLFVPDRKRLWIKRSIIFFFCYKIEKLFKLNL